MRSFLFIYLFSYLPSNFLRCFPLFETRCSRLFSGVQWKYYSMKSPEAWLRLRFNRIHHAGFTFGVRSVEVGLDQFSCHTTSLRMDWANTRTHKHFLKLSYTASANAVCQSDSRRTGPAHSTQNKIEKVLWELQDIQIQPSKCVFSQTQNHFWQLKEMLLLQIFTGSIWLYFNSLCWKQCFVLSVQVGLLTFLVFPEA